MVMAPPPTVVPNAALLPPAMGPPTAPGVMVPTLAMVPTTTPPGYFWPPPAQFQSPAIITKPKRTVEELELELDCERQKVARLESELVKERAKKLQMQKQLAVTTLRGITWQYEMNGSWHAFPQESNEQMHQAYLAYLHGRQSHKVRIISAGQCRRVDFKAMEQENLSTGKVRRIQVVIGVPKNWVTTKLDLLRQGHQGLPSFYVSLRRNEHPNMYKKVEKILKYSGHAQTAPQPGCGSMRKASVERIFRIENFQLWQRYQAKLMTLRQDHPNYNVPWAAFSCF